MAKEVISELTHQQKAILSEIETVIKKRELPESYPDFMQRILDVHMFSLRNKFIKYMGFLLLSKEWITALSRWIGNQSCLEVMSGTGALAYCLIKEGVSIIATDDYSREKTCGENGVLWDNNRMWTHVENLDAIKAVEKYGKNVDVIIMSWPPYNDEIAVKVLWKMREFNPSCIMLYVGEGEGGCTANDEFFSVFEEIEEERFSEDKGKYQKWQGFMIDLF